MPESGCIATYCVLFFLIFGVRVNDVNGSARESQCVCENVDGCKVHERENVLLRHTAPACVSRSKESLAWLFRVPTVYVYIYVRSRNVEVDGISRARERAEWFLCRKKRLPCRERKRKR